ncbi:MAG: SH3 domain-containing protein [Leptolyngbyaceae cyanobacterium bins.349]|nr:SH3 domain-containing protein [Leptolyngbyaceae cyanobacterium bins.349]
MQLLKQFGFVSLSLISTIIIATPGFTEMCRFTGMGIGDTGFLISREPGSPINVRDSASRNAYARHIGYSGDPIVILAKVCDEEGYNWYRVQFRKSGAKGWIRGDFIHDDRY